VLYTNLNISKKDSEVEIVGELTASELKPYEDEALETIRQDFEMQGFRKGQVPLDIVRKQVGAVYVLEEAAELALQDAYPQIIESQKLPVIGRPQVAITKLAPGNPVAFHIRIGLEPEFALPNYRHIGANVMASKKPVQVSDEEVTNTIAQILKLRNKDSKQPVPELTDEFAKTLGAFQDAADLRAKIRASMIEEKNADGERVRREEIAAKLLAETSITVPAILIEEELAHAKHERENHVKKAGITVDEYAKRMNTTVEELEKKEREYVERQIKTKLILEHIAAQEKIEVDPKDIDANLHTLRGRYPDAEPERLANYVRMMLVNEKVLELLENQQRAKSK
jgi:trigger factor